MNQSYPVGFNERVHSDGILCDVNVVFNAMKMPHGAGIRSDPDSFRGEPQRPSRLADAVKICFTDVLNGFTKEELKTYLVQILLNACPSNDTHDHECPTRDNTREFPSCLSESTGTNSPQQSGIHQSQCNDAPVNSRGRFDNQSPRGGEPPLGFRREYFGDTDERRRYQPKPSPKSTDDEEKNFKRIMSLLDLLCEMGPLISRPSGLLREQDKLSGPNSSDRGYEECEENRANLARRPLHQEVPQENDDAFCPPLSTQTPDNLYWPPEDLNGFSGWLQCGGRQEFTPYRRTASEKDEAPCTPRDADLSRSAMSGSDCLMAKRNIDTVIHQRPPRISSTTGGYCTSHSSPVQPKAKPTPTPRQQILNQSLHSIPRPLVTPRMALKNRYLRMNRTS